MKKKFVENFLKRNFFQEINSIAKSSIDINFVVEMVQTEFQNWLLEILGCFFIQFFQSFLPLVLSSSQYPS
ncbi:hypothetical protein, partial [Sphingobacterium bovisgrunnientis]|uniref:hypothetical protein n=1 Tax=Sphingobacterium bovisgrunnientis TaxID=1874697 RepID=UPI00195ACAC5